MDGSDICFEIVRRAMAGFVYSEAVARYCILTFYIYNCFFYLKKNLIMYIYNLQSLHAANT